LEATACTTPAMLYVLIDMAETSRTKEKVEFAEKYLKKIALQAAGHLMQSGGDGGQMYLRCGNSLPFSASSVVDLKSSLSRFVNRQVLNGVETSWKQMVESGLLSDQFGAASLMNFVVFVVFVRKHRRSRFAAPFTGRLADLLEKLRHGVVTFLAAVLRGEIRRIIRNNPGIEDRQIPSRKRQRQMDNQLVPTVDPGPLQVGPANQERKNKKKKTVMADLNTIWNLLAEARECKVSLAVLLRTKKKEVGGGSSEATVDYWSRKMQAMYMARASLACTGLTHFNLLTDAARFSTDETIVSIVYSPESDFAVFLNNQKVKGGGKEIMHPNEFPMEPGIERLAAERRVDRLASYRLLQALSNQLKHVTNNNVTLASFLVDESSPSGLILKPMSPDVLRIVQRDQRDNVSRVLLRNKRSGVATVVDALAGLREAKFLTLQMDQGPVGMSAVSYMMSNFGGESFALLHCTWDGFHRVIRDMRLSMPKPLQQAILASSYVWSINEKPFHQGGFHADKKDLLETFMQSSLEDRTFRKQVWIFHRFKLFSSQVFQNCISCLSVQ